MHSYTTENEKESLITFYLAVVAGTITVGINSFIGSVFPTFVEWIWAHGAVVGGSTPAITVIAVWKTLELVFRKWLWCTLIGRAVGVKTPDFRGVFVGTGQSSYLDAEGKPVEFSVELVILQDWKKISVEGKFGRSNSSSYNASIEGPDRATPVLVFNYNNKPTFDHAAPESFKPHEGSCKIWKTEHGYEGIYYTGDGRKTQGKPIVSYSPHAEYSPKPA